MLGGDDCLFTEMVERVLLDGTPVGAADPRSPDASSSRSCLRSSSCFRRAARNFSVFKLRSDVSFLLMARKAASASCCRRSLSA